MISKGGSEALLQTLVNLGRSDSKDYSLLIPLLRLLVRVGQKDANIGEKCQKLEATDVTLSLARRNLTKFEFLAPCLDAIRMYASNVPTGSMLGINGAMELLFKVITPYNRRHTQTIKRAVNRGYVNGLLQFYQDWHSCDSSNNFISIRRGLLRCLKHITNVRSGRDAFLQAKGMEILFTTAQDCLPYKNMDSLVNAAIQVLRKCCPKCTLPMSTIRSSYAFHIPGTPRSDVPVKTCSQDDDSEDEEEIELEKTLENLEIKDDDDDLETDLNKLKFKPNLDRPEVDLKQYKTLFPELDHNFKVGITNVGALVASRDHCFANHLSHKDRPNKGDIGGKGASCTDGKTSPGTALENCKLRKKSIDANIMENESKNDIGEINRLQNHSKNLTSATLFRRNLEEPGLLTRNSITSFKVCRSDGDESENFKIVNQLLECHRGNIPFHNPQIYMNNAEGTKSVPDFKLLAFPDFWGHCSPPYSQKLEEKKYGSQSIFTSSIFCICAFFDGFFYCLLSCSLPENSEQFDTLKFYSKFESGNLRNVIQVREFEYDLIMNADVNTSQHHQWFYFEVSAMRANVPYRFNVINCEKVNSQFNYGMQPLIYSVTEALRGKSYWVRTGHNIAYYKNLFCFRAPEEKKRRRYYTLTFTLKFPHNDDVCYLAYHYPYTYTALTSHLQLLEQRLDSKKIYFKQQTMCHTLGGNPCPIVTITARPTSRCQIYSSHSPCSSWRNSDPIAEILRELFIFKIIPMLNPDGVINGNHRCSLNGEDLNRHWVTPDSNLQPTIYHLKGLLYYLNSINKTPLVFCDYHGHSQRKNMFFYGCSIKETLWQAGCAVDSSIFIEDVGYRALPKILDKITPAFSMANSSFLVEKSRASTARVVVWREIGVLRSYTMESTYCGFNQGSYKGLQVGTKELEEMGAKFCFGLLILKSKSVYSSTLPPQVEALLEAEKNNVESKEQAT
uniref:AGBL carboxypeptidase 1 n=1 Tax=Leptobrachium leishanense TaxID=445787 RepID=A0A8C5ML15_9ANUR